MKYNGKELIIMSPEEWDGKSREMLVWNDYDTKSTLALVCGFTIKGHPIADTGNYKKEHGFKRFNVFQYGAEIPKEESIEELKSQIERLKEDNKNLCNLFNDKSDEYENLLEENESLKEENKKLKNELNERITNELRKIIQKEMDLVYEERYL